MPSGEYSFSFLSEYISLPITHPVSSAETGAGATGATLGRPRSELLDGVSDVTSHGAKAST